MSLPKTPLLTDPQTAVITEGLRYIFIHLTQVTVRLNGLIIKRWGYGVTQRLERISPDAALQYKNWTIPPGVRSPLDQKSLITSSS